MKRETGTDEQIFHAFHRAAEIGRLIGRMRKLCIQHGHFNVPSKHLEEMVKAYQAQNIHI